jgi:hypothetical protein
MGKSLSEDLRWHIIYCQAEGFTQKEIAIKGCMLLVKQLLVKSVGFLKNGDV